MIAETGAGPGDVEFVDGRTLPEAGQSDVVDTHSVRQLSCVYCLKLLGLCHVDSAESCEEC